MVSDSTTHNNPAPWRGWIQLLLGLGLTFLFFYMMAPFMLAILMGAVIAIICYPIYALCNRKIAKPLSAFIVTMGVTLGVLGPFVFALYTGTYRTLGVVTKFRFVRDSQTIENLVEDPWVRKSLAKIPKFIPIDKDWLQSQSI